MYTSVKRNPQTAMTAGKSHVFHSVKIFMIFLFFCKICKHKTPTKNRNDSRKIAFFLIKIFMIFFFMQRFCLVNHVLVAGYASVKHNPKSAMIAGKSRVFLLIKMFMIFFFFESVKHNPKSAMTAGKSNVCFYR